MVLRRHVPSSSPGSLECPAALLERALATPWPGSGSPCRYPKTIPAASWGARFAVVLGFQPPVQGLGWHAHTASESDGRQHPGCDQFVGLRAPQAEHLSDLLDSEQEPVRHRSPPIAILDLFGLILEPS